MSETNKSNQNQKIPVDPQTKEALKNLGFTDYYVNIYLCLLTEGEMNAHELSEKTGVPYSRIYEVLNEMIKREMITKIDGRPSTFTATNPQDMFQSLKKQHDEDFHSHMQTSLAFLSKLNSSTGETKQINFSLHQGKKAAFDHIRNFIISTVKTLYFCFRDMEELYPEIEKNLNFIRIKGVQIKFLLEEKATISPVVLENLKKFGEIKYCPRIVESLLVADEKLGLQVMKGHFNIAKPSDLDYMVFSSSNALHAMYLIEIFTNLWKESHN